MLLLPLGSKHGQHRLLLSCLLLLKGCHSRCCCRP